MHRLNAALPLVDWRALRWNVTVALAAIVLALLALAKKGIARLCDLQKLAVG